MNIQSVGKEKLPLMKFLGSDDFPLVFARSDGEIYHVGKTGRVYSDISSVGWNSYQINNSTYYRLESKATTPRIFVASNGLIRLSFEYFDNDTGHVDVNYRLPSINKWIGDLPNIAKTNSGGWKNYSSLLPDNKEARYH